jgi:hypothetical protein
MFFAPAFEHERAIPEPEPPPRLRRPAPPCTARLAAPPAGTLTPCFLILHAPLTPASRLALAQAPRRLSVIPPHDHGVRQLRLAAEAPG